MTWPFDDGSALPVFDGLKVGGQQARTMAERAGGYSGIRTVIEQNPDGSITTLRTRNGNPIYETTYPTSASTQADLYRGFVAKASSRAVLFDPYTLEILNANYTPALNTYTVLDFATSCNVAPDDTTNWFDVALFDGTTIKINGKAMPTLGITANHGFPAIPYVINRETSEDQYGNAERNTTEKRVFAVGRDRVKSWGGGGVTEVLTPTDPVSESRAMTIGPRLDFSTDKAWLGQIYHPATGWDGVGEWAISSAEVTMLLASTYLVKVSASSSPAIAVAPLSFVGGTTAGSFSETFELPTTNLFPVGVGEVIYTNYPTNMQVDWLWREIYAAPLQGKNTGTHSSTTATASISDSINQIGFGLNVSMENTKVFDYRSTFISVPSQYVELPSDGTKNVFRETQHKNADGYYWSGVDHPISAGARGEDNAFLPGDNVSLTTFDTTNAVYDYDVQTGAFYIELSGRDEKIVNCSFSVTTYSGEDFEVHTNGVDFSYWIDNPTANTSLYTALTVENASGMSVPDQIAGWGNIQSLADSWVGSKSYRLAQQFFSDANSSPYINYYYATPIYDVLRITANVQWTTKDFILYDETNGVYISVEASFVGVDTSATLTVSLKVQTRHHTTTQTLGEYNYTYSQLVKEREIGSTGKYAMPSPQIRAIFAPLYQEQGSFKGAHYVTEEEENNGASPAHLFNFVLHLEPYSSIGTINDDNATNATVHFVPCNLLEMLYAFVFSQEYGVAEDGQRYPVTFTTRYNDMMNTLFSTPVRVSVRDGVQGNWSDALGSDFASISTVSLHRV